MVTLVVEFSRLRSVNLSYDSLTLYDGDSNKAPIIGEYSGSSVPTSQISSTNSVLIRFQSNGYLTYTGFQLKYHQYDPFPGEQRS